MDEYGFTIHEDCFRQLAAQKSSAETVKKEPPGN
jgi:hypothetical protein